MTSGQRALRRGLAITVAVLVVVGCGTDPAGLGRSGTPATPTATVAPSTTGVVDVSGTELTAGLVPFTECDELLRHLRAEATERVGPYGLDGGWFGGPVVMEMAIADGAMTAPAVGIARSMEEGVDYSGTNVQEAGIDEPDILKTDGRRIVVVEDDYLHYVDVSGPTAVLTGTLRLEGHWSRDLLLAGNRAFLIADTHLPGDGGLEPYDVEMEERAIDVPSPALARLLPPGTWTPLTSVIEVDLSDPANLRIAGLLTVQGRHVSSRVVGGSARVVVVSAPSELPFVYPTSPAGEERAERFNREVVAETVLADWMPDFVLESAGATVAEGSLNTCTDVSRPVDFAGFSTLSVLTVPLYE
ncbi:MAG: beta-propeller domain-containing protein, partial [Actinomycetota bacterium]|nr:beta-propeller domain-containing protein [Actinomycetota bacterium]